ncbi:MAG: hypothetical protein IID60_10515, partial [Proteobacteria bacterium]|nr:hypothetical protein [Pseudomonadota bacterium]
MLNKQKAIVGILLLAITYFFALPNLAIAGHGGLSVSVTSVPSSVAGNASYSISWSISGASSVTHTNVHWGTSPGNTVNFSPVQTGGSGSYSDTLTAPASGTIYFIINTEADGTT